MYSSPEDRSPRCKLKNLASLKCAVVLNWGVCFPDAGKRAATCLFVSHSELELFEGLYDPGLALNLILCIFSLSIQLKP